MYLQAASTPHRFVVRFLAIAALLAIFLAGVVTSHAVAQEGDQSAAVLSISVSNDAPAFGVEHGTVVSYEFVVSNPGDLLVSDIIVVDTLCGDLGTIADLGPGESVTLASSAKMTGTGRGTVTALGRVSDGGVVTASTDHAVEVFIAHEWLDYAVTLSASSTSVDPGEEIVFTMAVENLSDEPGGTGDVELTFEFDESVAELVGEVSGSASGSSVTWVLDGPSPGADPVERSVRLVTRAAEDEGRTLRADAAILVAQNRTDFDPSNDHSYLTVAVGQPSATIASAGTASTTGLPEPFLPFTGAPAAVLWLSLAAGSAGTFLRRAGRPGV